MEALAGELVGYLPAHLIGSIHGTQLNCQGLDLSRQLIVSGDLCGFVFVFKEIIKLIWPSIDERQTGPIGPNLCKCRGRESILCVVLPFLNAVAPEYLDLAHVVLTLPVIEVDLFEQLLLMGLQLAQHLRRVCGRGRAKTNP